MGRLPPSFPLDSTKIKGHRPDVTGFRYDVEQQAKTRQSDVGPKGKKVARVKRLEKKQSRLLVIEQLHE